MTELSADFVELEQVQPTSYIGRVYECATRTSKRPGDVGRITARQVRSKLLRAWRWLLRARPREALQLIASIESRLSDLDDVATKCYCAHIAVLRAIACAMEHSPEALLENVSGLAIAERVIQNRARVQDRGERLSPRERAVLVLISQGQSNKRVARALNITPETVKSHLKRVFVKLGSRTRAEAVARATALGLLAGAASESMPHRTTSSFPSMGDSQTRAARQHHRSAMRV